MTTSTHFNGKSWNEWKEDWNLEERYNFHTIEEKWQKIWEEEKAYKVEIDKNGQKIYKVKMCALETYFNLYHLLCSLGYEVEIVALDSLWLN